MHVVVGEAGGAARHALDTHHFIIAAVCHAVVIVADQKNDRQTELVAVGEMIGELRLRGEVQRFQHDTVGVCAVAGETTNDIAALQIAIGQSCAGGDGHAAADDGVCAEVSDRKIGNVHRAATTATVAVILAEEFANSAIDVFLHRRLD